MAGQAILFDPDLLPVYQQTLNAQPADTPERVLLRQLLRDVQNLMQTALVTHAKADKLLKASELAAKQKAEDVSFAVGANA